MRKATLFLLFALFAISAHAAIVASSTQTISTTLYSACNLNEPGELVDLTGTIQTTVAYTRENGWIIGYERIHMDLRGTGETTGMVYSWIGVTEFTFKLPPDKLVTTGTYVINQPLVGGTNVIVVHFNANYSIEPLSGNFIFSNDNFFVKCQ